MKDVDGKVQLCNFTNANNIKKIMNTFHNEIVKEDKS